MRGRGADFAKVSKTPFVPQENIQLGERAELILSIQAQGLARRLSHTGAKTAVIGISGGLDSSLALLVSARAFKILGRDKKNIVAVTMPGFGTTGKTFDNSLKLIECTGASGRTINISESVLKHFEDIGHEQKSVGRDIRKRPGAHAYHDPHGHRKQDGRTRCRDGEFERTRPRLVYL